MNTSCQNVENVELATKIFNEHQTNIRKLITYQVNDPTTVEDILHDFFLSLVRRPISPNMQNIKSYLYRAVRNDVIDASIKQRNYKARILRYAQIKIKIRKSQNPQKIAQKKDEIKNTFQLIENNLPHRQAQAILQRYKYGLNTTEAAKGMNIDKKSFSRYLCVGMKKVKEIMEQQH